MSCSQRSSSSPLPPVNVGAEAGFDAQHALSRPRLGEHLQQHVANADDTPPFPVPRVRVQYEAVHQFPWSESLAERYSILDEDENVQCTEQTQMFGDEAGEHALVWKKHFEIATRQDEDQVERWSRTLDILLLFAGLFSAVATAFVGESAKDLQPNWAEYQARIIRAEILVGGKLSASTFTDDLDSAKFQPSARERWTNGIWTASLCLSLLVALLSILAKQWVSEYVSRTRAPATSPRQWSIRRTAYSRGLDRWKLGLLIGLLPVVLHNSLFLFFIGLALYFWKSDRCLSSAIIALIVIGLGCYLVATLAPLWDGECPSFTPVLGFWRSASHRFLNRTFLLFSDARDWLRSLVQREYHRKPVARAEALRYDHPPAFDASVVISANQDLHTVSALHWMVSLPESNFSSRAVVEAIGGLDPHRHAIFFQGEDGACISRSQELGLAMEKYAASIQGQMSAATISRILRTSLLVGRLPPPSLNPAIMLAAEQANTHDVHIMVRYMFPDAIQFSSLPPLHEKLQSWAVGRSMPPCLTSTVDLITTSPLTVPFLGILDIAAFWSLAVDEPTRNRLANHLETCMQQRYSAETRWRPFGRTENVWLRGIYLWGYLWQREADANTAESRTALRALQSAISSTATNVSLTTIARAFEPLAVGARKFGGLSVALACLFGDILAVLLAQVSVSEHADAKSTTAVAELRSLYFMVWRSLSQTLNTPEVDSAMSALRHARHSNQIASHIASEAEWRGCSFSTGCNNALASESITESSGNARNHDLPDRPHRAVTRHEAQFNIA